MARAGRPFAAVITMGVLFGSGCTLTFDRSRIGDEPSCEGLAECLPGIGCCDSARVQGGSFSRGYDRSDMPTHDGAEIHGWQELGAAPAVVSSFRMDLFEVTVGRFRQFLEGYDEWRTRLPREGDGAHPSIDGSGWQADFSLDSRAAIEESLVSCGENTWDRPSNDQLAINCVSWHVAFAFCIWDDGRLPTEAEWSYAAVGGDQQRALPWSDPPSAIDTSRAVIGGDSEVEPVGSRAPGDGARWGHHDLAGNVREWVLDYAPTDFGDYPVPCEDCANLTPGGERIRRGGDYAALENRARTAYRSSQAPADVSHFVGIRCVRSAP